MRQYILAFSFSALFIGCQSKSAENGLTGGTLRAGAITSDSQKAAVSIAIERGFIGASLDEQDRKIMEQRSPRTVERMDRGEPLTVNDIIKLHEGGVSDDSIIGYIEGTNTAYNLSQVQVKRLNNAGLSNRVITYLLDTGR